MLKTKSIKAEKSPEDGQRISVMSRHTLEDGLTPDTEISPASYDVWLPEVGPPPKLIGAYLRREINWEEYEAEYKRHLRAGKVALLVGGLALKAENTDITLLCVESSPEHCHRRILAQECLISNPDILLQVR